MITADRIKRLAPSARPDLVAAILQNWPYAAARGIDTPRRIRHFLAQICVETGGLRAIEENLRYSAKRLTQVWPSRFKSIAAAKPYANNPEKLANKVYGGRLGNTKPGDGWRYRGGGYIQTTGRHNYARAGYEDNPDDLRNPAAGFAAAVTFWTDNGCNAIADRDDVTALRRRINGGAHGLADCKTYLARAKRIWTEAPADPVPTPPARPAPAPAPSPAPAIPAMTEDRAKQVQQRLRDIGYFEVGEMDGKWGSRSRGALLAFKADNGLPLTPDVDDDTMLALMHAAPRVVGKERASTTAEELAKKSVTVEKAQKGKFWSALSGFGSAIVAAFWGAMDYFGDALEKIEPIKGMLASVPVWLWFVMASGVAFALWKANAGVESRVVEDYRKGKKL